MKISPEWMFYESRVRAVPKRSSAAPRPRAPYVGGEWAYHPDLGLVVREPDDGGEVLGKHVRSLFDELWRSDTLPEPGILRELYDARSLVSDERVGLCVPRYWRCTARRLVVELRDGTQASYFVVQTSRSEGPRLEFCVSLVHELPDEVAAKLEPVTPTLLYDVSRAPRDTEGRALVFVEIGLDDGSAVVHSERVGVMAGLPPADGELAPRRARHETVAAALEDCGVTIEQLGLVARRDVNLPLVDILVHEARLRGFMLLYAEETHEGLRFAGRASRFERVRSFEELRDILRWHPNGF